MDPEINKLMKTYENQLLEEMKNVKCHGRLKFYEGNLFTYLKTDDTFIKQALKILGKAGFEPAPLWYKSGSPKSHISLMTNKEQDHFASSRKCSRTTIAYKGESIEFNIEEVRMTRQFDKIRKQDKIACILMVQSSSIEKIRLELGLKPNSTAFSPHIYLCHKFSYKTRIFKNRK